MAHIRITEILAPGQAAPGEVVPVTARIQNLDSIPIGIMAVGVPEYPGLPAGLYITGLGPHEAWVNTNPGWIAEFSGYFLMPGSPVTVHIYGYFYGTDGLWHLEDQKTRAVMLGEVLAGTLTQKQLEYNESRATIPASNIPQGKRGLVHVWGRNDTASAKQMGIWWQVRDPDGFVRETYSAWEAWPYTGGGQTHEFIGGRFDLDKAGNWNIEVQLFMQVAGQQSPALDSYSGRLCTVTAPAPAFSDFQITSYSRKV